MVVFNGCAICEDQNFLHLKVLPQRCYCNGPSYDSNNEPCLHLLFIVWNPQG